ncbi:Conserved_hypothetical protein [Hexamita inflata]|uniref:Uncharacterized protein n=1 Tax=Hexamita inflata TaxID=28002 RepID=A0AA86NYH4_9EUKA|nr:Conserved hypothetical protein [Hexamita inflata]CAI9939885.1 Conserved hypothetical protein [Hexamita inflata]CAI9963875.1 Conserved hypothetical protein [Hexamita inflata]
MNYRFISPTEIQFYGLRSSARFITTKKLRFKIQNHKVTVPKGFVADGFEFSEDFSVKPVWLLVEWIYATHKYDYQLADRGVVDIHLFNAYPEMLDIDNDELILNGVRISGDDLWQEALERGYAICPEIVEEINSYENPYTGNAEQFIGLAIGLIFSMVGFAIAK